MSSGQEFETLYTHVLAIDATTAGSLGKITQVRAEVESALDDERIVIKQWRALIEELAMLHGKALASA